MRRAPLLAATSLIAVTLGLNYLIPEAGDFERQGERIGRLIPSQFGEWKLIRDLPVAPEEKLILGTDDILHREYAVDGDEKDAVLLSLVFSTGHRHSMHPPEVCYQAAGYTLVSRGVVSLESELDATLLRLSVDNSQQLVNYWFFSGGKETQSYIWHQVHLVIDQVLFRTQPSVLVRLSTTIRGGDADRAQARLSAFAHEAVPILRQRLPQSSSSELLLEGEATLPGA